MKKILILIVFGSIYLSLTGCNSKNNPVTKENISLNVIDKLSSTTKIIIKNNNDEPNNTLGTITDLNVINEVIKIISNAKQTGDIFNCDGHSLNFEMYDNDKLIDTIYVWTNNERIIPASIQSGCSYYTVSSGNTSLKNIIEQETGFIFYTIYDYTEGCNDVLELIYEDDHYKYYFNCTKSNNVFIEFNSTGLKITLKEALNNNYITPNELLNKYPDLLIKKSK